VAFRFNTKIMNSKKSVFLILLTFLTLSSLYATILRVDINGGQQYTSIQNAVDDASSGDTVLVYPGTYLENIDLPDKGICLGSLILTTGDYAYVSQTIINGNQTGSCILGTYISHPIEVNGLTLMNGSGTFTGYKNGGGIGIRDAEASIKNCIIKDNNIDGYGAGVYCKEARVFLSGTVVKNNHTTRRGGGVMVLNGEVIFDSLNLSSVFLNYAAMGTDYYKLGDCPPVHIYLDTATVEQPDHYYLFSDLAGYPVDDITYSINTGKIQQVSQDLFVAPTGSNSNSGISISEPLKDIGFALLKIASDSINPNTIHLANGMYAPSTGEKYPLNLKSYVSISGEVKDSTILDGENAMYIMRGNYETGNYTLKDMTFQHGDATSMYYAGAFKAYYNNNVSFKNLVFRENTGYGSAVGTTSKCNNFVFENVDFMNNLGGPPLLVATSYSSNYDPPFLSDTVIFLNCRFHNNTADTTPNGEGVGGGMSLLTTFNYTDSLNCYIMNSEFCHNVTRSTTPNEPSVNAITQLDGSNVYLINSTLGDNELINSVGGAVGVTDNSKLYIYNSILFNNQPAQLWLKSDEWTPELSIYNSLIEGGQDDIQLFTNNYQINYDPTNIDADPLWANTGYYPYMLSYGSPCINTGTLDLPDHIQLPETDLAGNPRVYDGQIDMGAYEFGPWVGIDYQKPMANSQKLKASPNPFCRETRIRYQNKEKGKQCIFVYDINGSRVATLMDITGQPGSGEIIWDGKNDYGRELPAGVYCVEFIVNEESKGNVKVVKE
jgi:Protein of unknown function (DUF1565)